MVSDGSYVFREVVVMAFMMGSFLKVGCVGVCGESEVLHLVIGTLNRIFIRKVFERNGFGQRGGEGAVS